MCLYHVWFVFWSIGGVSVHVLLYFNILVWLGVMSLLVHPNVVVLPIRMIEGVSLFCLVVDEGVRVTETVTGLGWMTLHLLMYSDILIVDTTIYRTSLMVVQLYVYVGMCLSLCDIVFVCSFVRLARTRGH